jgi:hypothetical protein
VFQAYASRAGVTLLDRALYLPKAWTDDRFSWVTGDSVYGGDRRLRVWLEEHAIRHVLAVKRTEPLLTMTDRGPGQVPAERLLAEVEPERWLRLNAGDGTKGKRFYDWVRVPLYRFGWPANVGFWLLARRSTSDPSELAFYICFAPADTPLATLVRVAGWPLAGRGGLRAGQGGGRAGPLSSPPVHRLVPPHHPGHDGPGIPGCHPRPAHRPDGRDRGAVVVTALGVLVALTVPELRRLLVRLVWSPPRGPGFALDWSVWRRRHQATARRCHYQRQRIKLRL